MLCFLTAIGGDIHNIKLAVVNNENSLNSCHNYIRQDTAIPYGFVDCNFTEISCRFLEDAKDPMITQASDCI